MTQTNTGLHLPGGYRNRDLLPRLSRIRQDTLGFLLDCARDFGPVTYFEAGRTRAFFVNHPEGIKHILQDNAKNYSKNTIQYNALATITGRGLLTSDGSLWFRQRRLEQPAFARPRLMALDRVVIPAARSMLDRWEAEAHQGEPLDIDGEMMRTTLEIVGKSLFSIDLSGAAHELTGAVLTTLDHIVHRARNPFYPPNWVPTARNLRFRAALKRLDRQVYSLMHDRQRVDDLGEDLLGMLLRARDDEGQPMSPRQVRDEIITLLIAGHETVASALTWTWYLLAQNPLVREKLVNEVQTVLGEREPASADLASLPYTAAVFEETLRLYPPAWLITRSALEPDVVCGFDIPAGSLIILSPYVIQRQAQYWPDPEAFRPERFLAGTDQDRPRYAYIPFGGGPRLCIGSGFAAVEAQLMIAMIIRRFRLDLLPDYPVQVDALVTLRPHGGLPMRAVRAAQVRSEV